jgi:hypothetical protein
MRPMMVSAAAAGALISAIDKAAAAAVDKIASFFDTEFLPRIFHFFCDGCAWRAEFRRSLRSDPSTGRFRIVARL